MMEAVQTSETLVNSYQSAWCYNPEDRHLRIPINFPVIHSIAFTRLQDLVQDRESMTVIALNMEFKIYKILNPLD
jgi:hypothetical protein